MSFSQELTTALGPVQMHLDQLQKTTTALQGFCFLEQS
jgi:hypothetical protein